MTPDYIIQEKDGMYLQGYWFGPQGVNTKYTSNRSKALVFASKEDAEQLIEDISFISIGAGEALKAVEK